MAYHYPIARSRRLWGFSMTIAAIVLGLYFIALFYFAVIDQASQIDSRMEQADAVGRAR